jgi:hypothetical protein
MPDSMANHSRRLAPTEGDRLQMPMSGSSRLNFRAPPRKPLEEIDGSIELDGFVYLIEINWWEDAVDRKSMGALGMKVFMRDGAQVRGLFISASGYTEFN